MQNPGLLIVIFNWFTNWQCTIYFFITFQTVKCEGACPCKKDQVGGQIRCNILCSKIYQPVCGLDDKKYSNQCEADCAKTVCY